jgi:predicted ATP-dependent serine protease
LRSDVPLLEREHELGVVAGLVDAACAGGGAALVIEGPAGIGKTRLLASTCRSAAERQLTVLRTRGGESGRRSCPPPRRSSSGGVHTVRALGGQVRLVGR